MTTAAKEQTLILIKPDALKNSLTGYVLSQFSEFHTGLRFAAAKIVNVNRMLAEEHYAEHRGKAFYESLLEYIRGQSHYPDTPEKRRVIAIVYHGPGAIQKMRDIAGPTNPHTARDTRPGCIRALGAIVPVKDGAGKVIAERMDNLIHASATPSDAEREIKLWFRPVDIPPLMRCYPTAVCNEHFYCMGDQFTAVYEEGSVCLMAPGDIAWTTDLEALHALRNGHPAACSLNAIKAKYFINERCDKD